MKRIWKFKESAVQTVSSELVRAADDLPILAKLLVIRGITNPEEARAFLNIADYKPVSSEEFQDMEKAVTRLSKAIENREPILIYGDFDVDGITGTAILLECLKELNANVSFYIPSRHTEGHGLNSASLCRLVSSRQVKVVVTTDTGVSNFNEVTLLNGLNVDTIITDHHELPENLPLALAILNSKLLNINSPLAFLSGAGVAYKLAEALMKAHNLPEYKIDALLDLVAIGTVVDMVPLIRENRYLVWRGLQVLEKGERIGIKALLREAHVVESSPITAHTLGFVLGPRLNAIGRISDAQEGVNLLVTKDEGQAKQLAAKFEQLNRKRKELVEQSLIQAEMHLNSTGELTEQKAVILSSRDWNQGIVGLVATKLVEKYNRPCFIGYIDDETEEVRFSARSIEGFHMYENLTELEDMFIRWGGHSGAAGFSIVQKDMQKLKGRLFKLCSERISDQLLTPITWVDMKLVPSQVNPFLIEIVNKMAPFGQNNPLPVFGMDNISIAAQRMMGEDKNHLKLILLSDEPGRYIEAIHWNWGDDRSGLNPASTYRFAFTADLNSYNGSTKVQLLLKDLQEDRSENSLNETLITEVKEPSYPLKKDNTVLDTNFTTELEEIIASKDGIGQLLWVNHRGRDEIESFLSRTLIPAFEEVQDISQKAEDSTKRVFEKFHAASRCKERGAQNRSLHVVNEDSSTTATQQMPPKETFQTPSKSSNYRIFSEGTQQAFPFPLPEMAFCRRNGSLKIALTEGLRDLNNGSSKNNTENIVLWDLPPDMESLKELIELHKPKVVHLVGGKYEKLPLSRPPYEFLDGFSKVIHRIAQQHEFKPFTLELTQLSMILSTTEQVVISGLSLLSRLGLLTVSVIHEQKSLSINFIGLSELPKESDIASMIEYVAFKNALEKVFQFREWLMTAPIDIIRSAVALEIFSGVNISKEGRVNHAANVR